MASEIFLLVREDNLRAISLNKKLGFNRVIDHPLESQLKEEKVGEGVRRILMCLSLDKTNH